MQDPELKKLAWRVYRKYPEAMGYLLKEEAEPGQQLCEKMQLLVEGYSDLKKVYAYAKPEIEAWFVVQEWEEIPKLRQGVKDGKQHEKYADGRLLILWLGCHPGEESGYQDLTVNLSTSPGAHEDDCTSSEPFGQVSDRIKRGSGPSGLKF